MTPEHEKRLQKIEEQIQPDEDLDMEDGIWIPTSRGDDILDLRHKLEVTILWLIERLREAEELIPHCKISELHPGDTIVFKCPGRLTMSAVKDIEKTAAAVFDNEYPVIVLDGGLDLEIVRPAEEAEQEPAHMAELRHDALTNRTAAMYLAQIEAEKGKPK